MPVGRQAFRISLSSGRSRLTERSGPARQADGGVAVIQPAGGAADLMRQLGEGTAQGLAVGDGSEQGLQAGHGTV